MMTRTSAGEYRQTSGIYMNAVDTGWINDENPLEKARAAADTGFQTPLDEVDAAARVLDPIFGPLSSSPPTKTEGTAAAAGDGKPCQLFRCGLFYKDYAESEW